MCPMKIKKKLISKRMKKCFFILFLFLTLHLSAQEHEDLLYSNPSLSETRDNRASLLKHTLSYPALIAGKNLLDADSVVYVDTVQVSDTFKIMKKDTMFWNNNSQYSHSRTRNNHSFSVHLRHLSDSLVQYDFTDSVSNTTYQEMIFAGTRFYYIDTVKADSAYGFKVTLTTKEFTFTDSVTIGNINDSTKWFLSRFYITRRSVADREVIVITDSTCFFDDFSFSAPYPHHHLWEDISQGVYINSNYPVNPISIGVATFDALDKTGNLYPQGPSIPFTADTLLSKAFRFDSKTDSVFLSFFYQPAGVSDPPELKDSLVLQFYSPSKDRYYSVCTLSDDTVRPFRIKMVHVDSSFLERGFRFRFINYISYSAPANSPGGVGNCDIWNIDYVYLNVKRTSADSTFKDVAIIDPGRSILRRYESMPWNIFKQTTVMINEISPFLYLKFRNNDIANLTYQISANNIPISEKPAWTYDPGIVELAKIDRNATLPAITNPDSARYKIKMALLNEGSIEFCTLNDTVIYDQFFYNYFAYDDGTAESGYSLSNQGTANASLAYLFVTGAPDTLRAIDMFFNRLKDGANSELYFTIKVWDNDQGVPGNELYTSPDDADTKPHFTDGLNQFCRYRIDDKVVIVSDTFFIGWQQVKENPISLGLDKNRVNTNKIFYNMDGVFWNQSKISGSLMMRPVTGKELPMKTDKPVLPAFAVYPNPASDLLQVAVPSEYSQSLLHVTIFDLYGRMMLSEQKQLQAIDVSSFPDGMYILRIDDNRQLLHTSKFTVIH